MFILGLTGSVGMGKSVTAQFFVEGGVPVHDADAVVHRLYEGEAVAPIEAAFPGTTAGGKVDRVQLANRVLDDPAALLTLEGIVHPLVRREEERFLAQAEKCGAPVAVLDIPLLYETGAEKRCDAVVVVSARACDGSAGHDCREIRGNSRKTDAGRRKARAGGFRGGQLQGFRGRTAASA
jgi:dephospho-CoA kinase